MGAMSGASACSRCLHLWLKLLNCIFSCPKGEIKTLTAL